jgi:hypothetical protein
VEIDRTLVEWMIGHHYPTVAVLYYEMWDDDEQTVIRMDWHQTTLRQWIKENNILSTSEWLSIMLGIATRLVNAQPVIHKDLKPTNSINLSLHLSG